MCGDSEYGNSGYCVLGDCDGAAVPFLRTGLSDCSVAFFHFSAGQMEYGKDLRGTCFYEDVYKRQLFEGVTYPWEVLPKIGEFIVKLGNTLPEDEYEKKGENIWIAKSAKVAPSAYINGPAIIGKDAEIRHCAFIRGNALVGEGAVVGNSTELKNVVLFNKVQVPHYNYVGDSVLGFK